VFLCLTCLPVGIIMNINHIKIGTMKKIVFLLAILLIIIGTNYVSAQQADTVYRVKNSLEKMGLLDTIVLQKVHGKYFFYGFESGKILFYWGRSSGEKITTTLPRELFSVVVDKKYKRPVLVFNFRNSNFANTPAKNEDLSNRDPNELLMNEGLVGVPVYTVMVGMSPKRFDRERVLWNKK